MYYNALGSKLVASIAERLARVQLGAVNNRQEHDRCLLHPIHGDKRRNEKLARAIDPSRSTDFGKAFQSPDRIIDLADDARCLDGSLFREGVENLEQITGSSESPPNIHSLGPVESRLYAIFEALSNFLMVEHLAAVRGGNALLGLRVKPFVVADQTLNGFEHDR
jgi:hypothetical protein